MKKSLQPPSLSYATIYVIFPENIKKKRKKKKKTWTRDAKLVAKFVSRPNACESVTFEIYLLRTPMDTILCSYMLKYLSKS